MTRPTDAQLAAALHSEFGLILATDEGSVMSFVGHDETYGEFVAWLDCAGETIVVRGTTFLDGFLHGLPPESCDAIPGIERKVAAMFGGVTA